MQEERLNVNSCGEICGMENHQYMNVYRATLFCKVVFVGEHMQDTIAKSFKITVSVRLRLSTLILLLQTSVKPFE